MVTKEEIIKLNRHILAVSGGDFGIFQEGELDFAVDSINYGNNPIQQASNFMFYTVAGHPFLNGNKRTGFEIGKGIMESGGYLFTAKEKDIIGFVGSIAQGQLDKSGVVDWLSDHIKFVGSTASFYETTSTNIIKDKELLKKLD